MNIPQVTPPAKARRGSGPTPSMTPTQEVEAWSWYCAKRHLGTLKSKAREMGVSHFALQEFLAKARERERLSVGGRGS